MGIWTFEHPAAVKGAWVYIEMRMRNEALATDWWEKAKKSGSWGIGQSS
jgi:hypothetical protein